MCQCVYASAANNLYTIMMCAVHAIHIVVILNNEWFIVFTGFRDSSIRIYINCSIVIVVDHNKFIAHEEIQYDSVIVVLITL